MSCNEFLRNVAEFQKGYAFKSKDYQDIGRKIVKVSNLTDNSIDLNGCVCIDENKAEQYRKYELAEDDIIITTVGSWPTNPASVVGKVVKVKNEASNTLLNQNAVRVRGNEKIRQKYLYYLLKNNVFKSYIIGTAQGSASQASITQEDIKNFSFSLIPKDEQIKIEKILSSLDEKIELNNEMNKTLEGIAQALFKRWFVDFEFPNEEGKPYKSSGGEMVESELGMIPKKSEVKELGELCKLITKSVKPYENENVLYEHFSLPACDEGKVPKIEFGSSISSNKYKIDNDCILMSKLNPTTKRIWNPLCKSENSICSTEFMVYIPNDRDKKDFYYEVINSKCFSEFLVSKATGSTGSRQRVKPKETLEFKMVVLEEEIIYKFNRLVKDIHDKVQQNIIQNVCLKELRDYLLPKLMSGEIRVDDIEANL